MVHCIIQNYPITREGDKADLMEPLAMYFLRLIFLSLYFQAIQTGIFYTKHAFEISKPQNQLLGLKLFYESVFLSELCHTWASEDYKNLIQIDFFNAFIKIKKNHHRIPRPKWDFNLKF